MSGKDGHTKSALCCVRNNIQQKYDTHFFTNACIHLLFAFERYIVSAE